MTPEYRLAVALLESHPREGAQVLEQLPDRERVAVLRGVPIGVAAAALRAMARRNAAESLVLLGATDGARFAAEVPADEAADLLRRLPPELRHSILGELPTDVHERVTRVLQYPEGTAGALMDPAILDLPDDIAVADAQERVRGATRDLLYYLYVVDRARRLVGVLDIPELMSASSANQLRAVMHTDVDRLSAWAPSSVIRRHPGWRSYHAMPVVDDDGRLLGAIRYQTLRRLEEAAPAGGPAPASMTALALGELFHVGITGVVGSLVAAASSHRAMERQPPIEPREDGETRHG